MKKIKIKFSNDFIIVELNNSDTAKQIYASCPIKSSTNTWGNEIYFESAIKVKKDKIVLEFTEKEKAFNPDVIYKGIPNPTKI